MSYDKKFEPQCTFGEAVHLINEFSGRAFPLYSVTKDIIANLDLIEPKSVECTALFNHLFENLEQAVKECGKFYHS